MVPSPLDAQLLQHSQSVSKSLSVLTVQFQCVLHISFNKSRERSFPSAYRCNTHYLLSGNHGYDRHWAFIHHRESYSFLVR